MRFISLFGGIGGFDLALQRQGHECVYYNDFDKFAVQVYNYQNGTQYKSEDIRKVQSGEIPDHELLCAGFPCQSFSTAGKRGGFDDTRGSLFFEIVRIVKHKRPKFLLLENVKGLLNHEQGKTFGTIITSLWGLGYDVEWQVLNSKDFGVPQNRERTYIVGHLRGEPKPKIFPFRGSERQISEEEAKGVQANCLSATCHKGAGNDGMTLIADFRNDFRAIRTNAGCHTAGNLIITNKSPLLIKEATKRGFQEAFQGDSINFSVPNSKTRRGRVGRQIAQTIDTGIHQGVYDGISIRRLTPVECERLQGFPDGWTSIMSDTQRYKQCGNSVTVNVVEEIVKRLTHKHL